MSFETRAKSSDRLISHLNLQVDYLQQTNQELEDRIRELENGKADAVMESKTLRDEVDRLRGELRNIDRLAQQLEQEKQDAVLTADREIQEAQIELRNSQRIGENAEGRLLDTTLERDRLARENRNLKDELDALRLDVEKLNGLLDKVREDKNILSNKIQSVNSREKALVMELENYRMSPSRARRKDKSPSKLDNFVRNLEKERDHYREECESLQAMLQEYKCKPRGRSPSPKSRSPTRSNPPKKQLNERDTLTNRLKEVESERDFYRREFKLLSIITKKKKTSASSLYSNKSLGCDSKQSYDQLLHERDELQSMLSKFERHMAEIQANVKVLTKERDKTNHLYEQANDELQRLRREYVRSPKSPKASVTAQAILRRVESERDSSIADLRRMTTERDSLRERLRINQEQSINERSRLEQRAEDYENKARSINEDRIDLQSRNDALKDINLAQEDDIKALRLKLQHMEDDNQTLNNELSDLKILKSQVQSSLENAERELTRKCSDITSADDKISSLEKRINELLRESEKQTEDIVGLRATTTTLDREKDALQMALDERAERATSLDEQLSRREREISDMRTTMSTLESKLDRTGDELASSDREIRSLRRQLELSQNDLSDCTRAKESANRENRRLHDELTSLARQHQDLNIELDDATRSKEELKRLLEERDLRNSDLDGALASKERELQEVMDQYRKVSSERDGAESRYRACSDEVQALRAELLTADGERKRCMDRISVLERDITDHVRAQQSYESQISGFRSSSAALESDLEKMRSEKLTLQEDLHSARDINSKLDANKDQITRQLAAKSLETDQLKANCEDLSRELEIVHKHLEAERAGNKNLEELIAGVREKEFQAQLDAQEQKSESQLLRDKLALNESKLQSMGREVSSLRDRTSQLDAELEVTKRHLNNERYERERAVQELRRHGFPSPGLSRISRPHSPTTRTKSGSPTRLSFLDTSR